MITEKEPTLMRALRRIRRVMCKRRHWPIAPEVSRNSIWLPTPWVRKRKHTLLFVHRRLARPLSFIPSSLSHSLPLSHPPAISPLSPEPFSIFLSSISPPSTSPSSARPLSISRRSISRRSTSPSYISPCPVSASSSPQCLLLLLIQNPQQ